MNLTQTDIFRVILFFTTTDLVSPFAVWLLVWYKCYRLIDDGARRHLKSAKKLSASSSVCSVGIWVAKGNVCINVYSHLNIRNRNRKMFTTFAEWIVCLWKCDRKMFYNDKARSFVCSVARLLAWRGRSANKYFEFLRLQANW